MFKRKSLIILLTAVMSFGALAGCSGGNKGGSSSPSASPSASPSDGGGQVDVDYKNMSAEINIYGPICRGTFEKEFLPFLQEEFPNYKFNLTSKCSDKLELAEAITSGIKFDMLLDVAAGELREDFMPANLATPMNDMMQKHGIDPGKFQEGFLDSVTIDGDIYLLPYSNSNFVMYYNKGLFDRFGVDYPWNGMTWDEAIELANKITRNENGTAYIGLWMSTEHYLRVNQFSQGFVDPDTTTATVNNENFRTIFQKLFYENSRNPVMQARAKEKFFGHGDFNRDYVIAMYVYTTGWIRTYETSLPPEWGVVSVPVFEKGGPGVQTYAKYAGLTSTSQNPDAVMQVIKYLTSEEFQTMRTRQGEMTVLNDKQIQDQYFADDERFDEETRKQLVEAVTFNRFAPSRPLHQFDEVVIEGAFADNVIPEIVRGNMDVNTALQKAEEIANADLKAEMERVQ